LCVRTTMMAPVLVVGDTMAVGVHYASRDRGDQGGEDEKRSDMHGGPKLLPVRLSTQA
jgi:hypothetical protein